MADIQTKQDHLPDEKALYQSEKDKFEPDGEVSKGGDGSDFSSSSPARWSWRMRSMKLSGYSDWLH